MSSFNLYGFNLVDLTAFACMIYGAWRGLMRGLTGEMAIYISLGISITCGVYLGEPISRRLAMATRLPDDERTRLVFFLTMVGSYLVMRAVTMSLKLVTKFTFNRVLETTGGTALGLLRTFAFVTGVVLLCGLWPDDRMHRLFVEKSRYGQWVYNQLSPAYDRMAEKHPAMRLSPEGSPDSLPAMDDNSRRP